MVASMLAIMAVLVSGWILALLIDETWTYFAGEPDADESDAPSA
jgi:hypothetical protein